MWNYEHINSICNQFEIKNQQKLHIDRILSSKSRTDSSKPYKPYFLITKPTNNDVKDEQEINKIAQKELEKLNIKYKRILQVSGTPYYILASNEMIDKDAAIISKVSYSDMLKARDEWLKENPEEDPSNSPYFGIPTLHKIGLRLNKECRKRLAKEGVSTSISALFKVKGNKFVYEKEVESLMKSIFGDGKANTLAFLKNKKVEGNKICKHTMIVLPEIKAAEAMKDLLDKIIDTKEREVFCIVGHNKFGKNGAGELNDKLLELDNKGKRIQILAGHTRVEAYRAFRIDNISLSR